MKVCFYAINGHGLGHLSRCYAVAKKLRDLLGMLSIEADIQFLTTSEADYIVRDFPVFKVPSRACFKGKKAAASRYSANGKMMVSNILAHFSPDVLVMDTIAQGSFQEFSFVKDFAKMRVLIDRHKKKDYKGVRIHKAHLPLYDKILVPDDDGNHSDYSYDLSVQNKVHYVGKIHNFDSSEAWSRQQVRDYFHVDERQKLIYLSAGGGGDKEAEVQISRLVHIIQPIEVKVIIGYGTLSQTSKIYGQKNIISLTESGISKYFKGIDLAISAGGYNTYEELLAAKVKCLFFAQEKGMDLQERRIDQGVESGWHGCLSLTSSDEEIQNVVSDCLSSDELTQLNDRPASMGACEAAFEVISGLLSRNAERKLNARMAKTVIQMYSSGALKTDAIVESFQLWKNLVGGLEGEDAWLQRCIDIEENRHIVREINLVSALEKRLKEGGASKNLNQRSKELLSFCKVNEVNTMDQLQNTEVIPKIETYLTEKNYVD